MFLGKTKPTCPNSVIFEYFQKWLKNLGMFLGVAFKIFQIPHCVELKPISLGFASVV